MTELNGRAQIMTEHNSKVNHMTELMVEPRL